MIWRKWMCQTHVERWPRGPETSFPSKTSLCTPYPGEQQFQINLAWRHPPLWLLWFKLTGIQQDHTTQLASGMRMSEPFPFGHVGNITAIYPQLYGVQVLSFSARAKGGKGLRAGMRGDRGSPLPLHFASFLKAQTLQHNVYFFFSRICPKFDMCRKCLFNLPSFSFLPGHSNMR